MFRTGGSVKFIYKAQKYYKAVTLGIGRRRYSRATFRRARDAQAYAKRLADKINRFTREESNETA